VTAVRLRTIAASLGAALLLAFAGAPPAAATLDEEPVEADRRDDNNNATDNERAARLLYFQRQPAMVRYLLSTLEGRAILYRLWLFRQLYWRPSPPAAATATPLPEPQPGDLPAESILDGIDDDGPLPMIGAPGSGTALKAFDEIGSGAPPPVSILDQIDESPKPAINQAAPPRVESKR
jgi:hypothetical protein